MDSLFTPSYRASLIKRYGGRTPTTGEGIITGYYRPDLLPIEPPMLSLGGEDAIISSAEGQSGSESSASSMLSLSRDVVVAPAKKEDASSSAASAQNLGVDEGAIAEALRAAFVELSFDHGYPASPNGMPFWHKLDFENGFAYAAFQMYLESGEEGPREIFNLAHNSELLGVFSQQMQQKMGAQELNFRLQEYFILHYWYARSKAFDLYKETALRHQRLRKQVKAEDRHFGMADKILDKLALYFDEDRFIDEMTPKAALDALSKLVAIQRVSIGLPASGPLAMNQQPEATSFEMIMRTVAQKQGTQSQLGGGFGASTSHTRDMIQQVLTDPNAAASLQEVIIRISQVSSGVEATPEKRFPGKPDRVERVDEASIIEAEVRELNAGPK